MCCGEEGIQGKSRRGDGGDSLGDREKLWKGSGREKIEVKDGRGAGGGTGEGIRGLAEKMDLGGDGKLERARKADRENPFSGDNGLSKGSTSKDGR